MKKYPAKILLFGEHTVNLGSQALAMPLHLFGGHWGFSDDQEKQMRLMEFSEHLNGIPLFIKLDINRFKKELLAGLFFNSNIPTGYGAGSSGALVAAIFDRYCMVREGKDLTLLKKTFAQMESFFHGTSSGTDPLISYLNSAIVLKNKKIIKTNLPKTKNPFTLFLLNTNIERQATPFIKYFLEKNKETAFNQKLKNDYLPNVDLAINYYTSGEWVSLFNTFHQISEFQFLHLKKMIPNNFIKTWKAGISSNYFKLKICGAGGGGFILGLTTDFNKIENDFNEFHFIKI